jgi:hypothetical protein
MDKNQLKAEILRCGKDPVYFIRKYVKIRHPVRGLIPFSLFDYQEELLKKYEAYRFNIILKARQLGISEITASYCVWLMMFHRDKNILVMASKAETAKNIIKKVTTAFKHVPKWLMLANVITDNKLSVELDNGSQIKAIATSEDAGRSEALSLLIIDEAAFVTKLDELWTGLFPTVQAGGAAIVLSTPNGVGNKFHNLYTDADNGENEFAATKLMWYLHPERIADLEDDEERPGFKTSSWFRNEIKSANMGPRDVAQELECNFNASGDTMVAAAAIKWMSEGCREPEVREHWDRNLFVWWRPQPNKKYFITADVARGDGKDFSGAHVWDAQDMTQAAEYYGKIPTDEFAKILVTLGHLYNNALVVIENNTVGLACIEHVKLAMYENLYFSRRGDSRPGEAVNMNWGPSESDLIPGFTTSPKTRPLIIEKLDEYIRNHSITMASKRFVNELRTFIWNNGRAEAAKGANDDLVMAAAIGCWIRDTFLAPQLGNIDLQKKMIENITKAENLNTQIVGASKDPRFVSQRSMGIFPTLDKPNPLKIRLPNGREADFSWLLQ